MSTAENKLFIRRYFDTFNQGGGAAVADIVADEHLKEHIALYESSFPGYQLSAKEMIAEGDKVVVNGIVSGTHTGDLMGMPPTGKYVEVPLIIIYQVSGGKIVDHTMLVDQPGLMQQLSG